MRLHHNAAGVRVLGHHKGQGFAAAAAAHRLGRPVAEFPAVLGHRRHGGAGGTLGHLLHRAALDLAALACAELHRDLGHLLAAYRNGVGGDEAHGGLIPLRHLGKRRGPGVLGDVGVSADVVKQGVHAVHGEVDAVGQGVVRLGPAGVRVLQGLAGVEELVALLLAHLHQCLVEAVHLGHGEGGVLPELIQRRHRIHNDVRIGVRLVNGGQTLFVGIDVVLGAAAQVVGAKGHNDPPGVHDLHRLGNGHIAGVALEVHAFQAGDLPGAHAGYADGVGQVTLAVHHVAHGVAVAQKQRFLHILFARVLRSGQHGAGKRRGVDHTGGGIVVCIRSRFHPGGGGRLRDLRGRIAAAAACPDRHRTHTQHQGCRRADADGRAILPVPQRLQALGCVKNKFRGF